MNRGSPLPVDDSCTFQSIDSRVFLASFTLHFRSRSVVEGQHRNIDKTKDIFMNDHIFVLYAYINYM